MIFYFSATGNSKYVASKIAESFQDEIISITDCVNKQIFTFDFKKDEKVGFVSPVYFCGLPLIVLEFLEHLELHLENESTTYFYVVATYGTTSGGAGNIFQKILQKKGVQLQAQFGVKMPDSWTPMFNLSNKEQVKLINQQEEPQIEEIISKIKVLESGCFIKKKLPMFIVNAYYKMYAKTRKKNRFIVENSCIGCGICEKKCPVEAITMQDKKPTWDITKCILCLGCLHRCPQFAIQYGKKTKYHGQYTHPNMIV